MQANIFQETIINFNNDPTKKTNYGNERLSDRSFFLICYKTPLNNRGRDRKRRVIIARSQLFSTELINMKLQELRDYDSKSASKHIPNKPFGRNMTRVKNLWLIVGFILISTAFYFIGRKTVNHDIVK